MNNTPLHIPSDDEPFDLEHAPLDLSDDWGGYDWGGDGSNLERPVRAHVLAALRTTTAPYLAPVEALKQLGDPSDPSALAPGITQEHVPDLLRMMRDRELYTAPSDTDQVWAPQHAFFQLRNLEVADCIAEFLPLFDLEDETFSEELPELLATVGAPALAPLRDYLADRTRWSYGHLCACDALAQLGAEHPELREQAVAILSDILRDVEHYSEGAATGAMDALVELEAVEALPLIRHAFELEKIDELLRGPWGQVLADLGIEPDESDPLLATSLQRFEEREDRLVPRELREELQAARTSASPLQPLQPLAPRPPVKPPAKVKKPSTQLAPHSTHRAAKPTDTAQPKASQPTAQAKARKQKKKRKTESASRKMNRRKGK